MVWPPDSPWAPWWRTSKKIAIRMCKLAKVKRNDIVYELGSGDADALITSSQVAAKGVGIEIDPLRYLISKLKVRLSKREKKVMIIRGNFFDENISEATVVFVYLVPKTLDKLIPKFKKELKKGTRIVSYRYEMKLKETGRDKDQELYLYTI